MAVTTGMTVMGISLSVTLGLSLALASPGPGTESLGTIVWRRVGLWHDKPGLSFTIRPSGSRAARAGRGRLYSSRARICAATL